MREFDNVNPRTSFKMDRYNVRATRFAIRGMFRTNRSIFSFVKKKSNIQDERKTRRARRKPPCGRVRAASVLKFAGAPSCCITLRIPSRAPSLVCWQNCVRACLCVCVAFLPPFLGKNGKKEIATKKTKKPMKWVSFDFNVPYSSF